MGAMDSMENTEKVMKKVYVTLRTVNCLELVLVSASRLIVGLLSDSEKLYNVALLMKQAVELRETLMEADTESNSVNQKAKPKNK